MKKFECLLKSFLKNLGIICRLISYTFYIAGMSYKFKRRKPLYQKNVVVGKKGKLVAVKKRLSSDVKNRISASFKRPGISGTDAGPTPSFDGMTHLPQNVFL